MPRSKAIKPWRQGRFRKRSRTIARPRRVSPIARNTSTSSPWLSTSLATPKGNARNWKQAVKLDPQLAAAQSELGYLLSRSGDTAGAIDHFKLAVAAAPEWVEAWINLAAQLAIGGQYADARSAVETALKLDPENAQARKLSDRLAQDPAAQQSRP